MSIRPLMGYSGLFLSLLVSIEPASAQALMAAVSDDGRVYTATHGPAGFGSWTQVFALGGGTMRGLALEYFDEDAHPDLIIGRNNGNETVFLRLPGLSGGGFGASIRVGSLSPSGGYLMDVASGDFNEDGRADFVANTNGGTTGFFLSGPSGAFVRRIETFEGYGRGMDAGDVNGDGHLDLARARCCDGMVGIYLGDGAGGFAFLRDLGSSGSDPYGLAMADFNGDGRLDVIANEGGSGNLTLWRGNGDGTFLPGIASTGGADMDNYGGLDAYDYDRDGRADIVGVNYSGQAAFFVPGLGDGNFGPRSQISPGSIGNSLGVTALPYRHPRAPIASASPAEQTTVAGGTLAFDGSASVAAFGSIVTREWIWGDGTRSAGATADHTFAAKGRYRPYHKVTADNGFSDIARVLAIVTGPPPVAEAGGPYTFTEAQARDGVWTGEVDGAGTVNDGGSMARYEWNFMPDLTFSEDFSAPLDGSRWRSAGASVVDGTARLGNPSLGDWGASHLFSQADFPRRDRLNFYTRFKANAGDAVMFGFKNASASNHYQELQYAIYHYHGSINVYEGGNSRGQFRAIPYGDWYDFKIELTATGADYWMKGPDAGAAWDLFYRSTFMGTPVLKTGVSMYYQGQNEFDWIHVGNREEGRRVAHAFAGPGSFPVVLTVTDFLGQSDVDSAVVHTTADAAPVARTGGPYLFGEGSALNGRWVARLDGRASTDDHGISTYAWDFGDGTTGTGAQPTHEYATPGPWVVRLTVSDHAGRTHSDQGAVSFGAGAPPVADFSGPSALDETAANAHVWTGAFDAGASIDDFSIWRYEWNFGDGGTATGRTVSHGFPDMGDYTVTLTVFDHAGQSNSTSRQVTIVGNAAPVARIAAPARVDEAAALHQRWTVNFSSATSTDDFRLWRFEWSFGDGGTSTAANPSYQYRAPGAYTASLTAFDHAGQAHTASHAVVVAVNNPPVAAISSSATTVEGSTEVHFSGSASTDDFGISRYRWTFPETRYGFAGTTPDPAFTLTEGSSQNERMTVSGAGAWGNRYGFLRTGNVRGTEMFLRVRTPSTGRYAMVGFKNGTVNGSYTEFVHALYFASGTFQVYENGGYHGNFGSYAFGLEYEVRIVSKSAGGADYHVRGPGEPVWRLLYSSGSNANAPLHPGWAVYDGTWEFDELAVLQVRDGRDAAATFPVGGDVVLSVTDHGGQVDTAMRRITVITGNPPVARITSAAGGAIGLEIPFDASASADDYGIAAYEWSFGDGTPLEAGRQTGHAYANSGSYVVTLTVRDFAGQTHSATRTVVITGAGLVRSVPWQFNRGVEVPHEAWAGKAVRLKAVASTAPLPFAYTWDFGDGTAPVTGTVTTRAASYALEASHAYAGTAGTPYFARISITGPAGQTGMDTYPVILRDSTLTTEVNVAIDEGLWYLHKTQALQTSGGLPAGYWIANGEWANATASAAQAFLINGHSMLGNPIEDPYVETIQRGINQMVGSVGYAIIGPQSAGDPDANHNGIGLDLGGIYQNGAVMDALIATGAPDWVARNGGTNVRGRRLRDIVQDMADMYAWGQSEAGNSRGGWRYSWNGDADNSAAQWGAIGLIPAERVWGLTVPDFVKTENALWTAFSQAADGRFGYTDCCYYPWGWYGTTPSGMVQMAFSGVQGSQERWLRSENVIASNWAGFRASNSVYGFYAFAKSMRLARPQPVVNLRLNGLDWYGDDAQGIARTQVNAQRADGSWNSSHPAPQEASINTAWTIILLTPTLFEKPPVAVASASPLPGAIGQAITFDASASYHLDPSLAIASYAWDFDASDGIDWDHPDATGPVVTRAYGALGTYTATLRVGDNRSPASHATATVAVPITIPPHRPTAVPGGPYVAVHGEAVALDGSGSFDIDQGQGDRITRYGWETDLLNPRDFDEFTGSRPAGVTFPSAGTYTVGLRVTDNTAAAFPQAGSPDLTHDAYTTVNVQRRCLDNLSARVKETMVALTWAHDGSASYTVQRSTASPSLGFQTIGTTSSTYSTFIDYNVEINRTYYYRVQSANDCGSIAVSAVPRFRATNRRPVFTSVPAATANEGQAYAYDVNAADPDGTALTYFLDQGPAGMAINPATGVISFTPTAAQVGLHSVAVRASDGVMGAVQAFFLRVLPRPNLPPVAAFAGPDRGLTGQILHFDASASADPEGDDPLAFAWAFGDGRTAAGAAASHVYAASGSYVVTLFVTDSRGATGTIGHNVVIDLPNRIPIADAGGPYLVAALDTVPFDGTASSDPDNDALTFTWNYGDNSPAADGPSPRHVFQAEGAYQASLEVRDNRGGIATDVFTVIVTAPNHPPVAAIAASPLFTNPGMEIAFDASASSDADGHTLLYAWEFGDGATMAGDLVTHVYAQPGHYQATLTADDQHGKTDTAQVPLHINAPPVVAQVADRESLEDEPFLLEADATDADGHAITWSLAQGPGGMSIDAASGLLFWNPGNLDVGVHSVRLRASDGLGGAGERAFQLTVLDVNDAPYFTSAPALLVKPGAAYAYQASAADDDPGASVVLSLVSGPAGLTITPSGLVEWPDDGNRVFPGEVVLSATDGIASVTQAFAIEPDTANHPPRFTSTPPTSVPAGTDYSYQAAAEDEDGDPLIYALVLGPEGMTVTPEGLVAWPRGAGRGFPAQAELTVRDLDGAAANQSWIITEDHGPLTARISSGRDSTITSHFPLTGTAAGDGFRNRILSYREIGAVAWTVIDSSTTPVHEGILGTFDPTLLLNGMYEVRLEVLSDAGVASDIIAVVVDGGMKLGEVNFSKVDLTLAAPGLPLSLIREYDSRLGGDGDFGPGWNLDHRKVAVSVNSDLGEPWIQIEGQRCLGFGICLPEFSIFELRRHIITVRLSDDRIEKFGIRVNPSVSLISPILATDVEFIPLDQTTGTLEPLDMDYSVLFIGGVLYTFDMERFNPKRFRLTLRDGTVYVVDAESGLESMTDANGNTLSYGENGITHSSGAAISFERGEGNRIVRATDNAGRKLEYQYEDGLLARVVMIEDNSRPVNNLLQSLGYLPPEMQRKLRAIVAPDGRQVGQFEYDGRGRLVGLIDPKGNRVIYGYDFPNQRQCITDRLGSETCYEYNLRGRVTRKVDPLGAVWSYVYDAMDNLLSETDPTGAVRVQTFGPKGDLLTETDGRGSRTVYERDEAGRVLSVTDPLGRVTRSEYDGKGNLVATVDALGGETRNAYDQVGNLTSVRDPMGRVTTFGYDGAGNLILTTDPLGIKTNYSYDSRGNLLAESRYRVASGDTIPLITRRTYDHKDRLVKVHNPAGDSTMSEYDDLNRITGRVDELGRRTDIRYDSAGNRQKVIHPDGTADSAEYDAEGRPTASIDRAGRSTRFEYDAAGRLTRTLRPDNTATTVAYDPLGRVVSRTDAMGRITRVEYPAGCGCGLQAKVIDAVGNETAYEHDAAGNRVSVRDADGNRTVFAFDALNRQIKTSHPDGTFDSLGYDASGNTVLKRDQAGSVTRFEFDEGGRLVKVFDAMHRESAYAYDEAGNRISRTDALGRVTRFEYDNLGRRIRRILPLGQAETFAYDGKGSLVSATDFNGRTTGYAYDLSGRILRKIPDPSLAQPGTRFTYTATGRRATMTDATGITRYAYDVMDRLVRKESPQGTLDYAYDPAGRLASIRSDHADGISLRYTRDGRDLLSEVLDERMLPGSGRTSYAYDGPGNLQGYAYPNGDSTRFHRDALYRLVRMEVRGATGSLADYNYRLGPSGNRVRIDEAGGGRVDYAYDASYQMTRESRTGFSDGSDGTVEYSLDAAGNRLDRTSTLGPVVSEAYAYDDNDRYSGHGLDAAGNTLQSGGKTLTWDFEHRLIRVDSGATRIDMAYDGDGNRVSKTVDGSETRYLIDDLSLTGFPQVVEETREGEVVRVFAYGSSLISQRWKDAGEWRTRYYGYDGHGSVRMLSDIQGNVTDRYEYDAFGVQLGASGETPNEHRYAGERLDPDLGSYYLRARYLDPDLGRFLSRDVYEGVEERPLGANAYLYVENNAPNLVDPSGHCGLPEFGAVMDIFRTLVDLPVGGTKAKGSCMVKDFQLVGPEIDPDDEDRMLTSVYASFKDEGKYDDMCCEYRQLVKGKVVINGIQREHQLWEKPLSNDYWAEDGVPDPENPSFGAYGHRERQNKPSDYYFGQSYMGLDRPGITKWASYVTSIGYDFDVSFKGLVIDICQGRKAPIEKWKAAEGPSEKTWRVHLKWPR